MSRLSKGQKSYLREATSRYHQSLPDSPAEEFLSDRGLQGAAKERVDKFRIGYVKDPLPGHEKYEGFLAIPYLRRDQTGDWQVVSLRFRCVEPDCAHIGHGKYMTVEGDTPRLFNTIALIDSEDEVGLSEGELDAVTGTLCGIATVGVPGVTSWKPHFTAPFMGYETVWLFEDGDAAGRQFTEGMRKILPNTRTVKFPDGHDLSSFVLEHGAQALKERMK